MRTLILVLALVITASACGLGHRPSRNFAVDFVHAVEPDARCEAYYSAAGAESTHSAVCRMPTKVVLYCAIAADKGPACQALNGGSPQPAAPQAPTPPAPVPPPIEAPSSPPPAPPPTLPRKAKP